MLVKLEQKWIDLLTTLPESGMGYQRVDVRLQNDRVLKDVPVFNAEEIELPEEFADCRIRELQPHR